MTDEKKTLENLDIRCAKLGRKLAEIKDMEEKGLNQALAVLEQQGPYAMFLFVRARAKPNNANAHKKFEEECRRFLREIFNNFEENGENNFTDILKGLENLSNDLDNLLFAKDLLRTALSYARFYRKAEDGKR